MRTATLTQLGFFEAATAWLETRRPYISPKTFHEYQLNINTLTKYFAELRLPEIDGDQVRAYQRMRMAECGPHGINHECGLLCQIRKRIGMPLKDYQPLPLPKEPRGRALRDEERKRLLEAGRSEPNWMAAYIAAILSLNTTAGPKEIFTLRLKDVNVKKKTILVQPGGAKNVHRSRIIPLNEEAFKAVELAMERAKLAGSVEPDHYLFPYRFRGGNRYEATYDPTRHQTTFKTAWNKLKVAAKVTNFRLYDCRHHAITVVLENPKISEETAESLAGHISRAMKKRYSHVRIEAKRRAVEGLFRKAKRPIQSFKKAAKSEKSTESTEVAEQLVALLSKLLKTG